VTLRCIDAVGSGVGQSGPYASYCRNNYCQAKIDLPYSDIVPKSICITTSYAGRRFTSKLQLVTVATCRK